MAYKTFRRSKIIFGSESEYIEGLSLHSQDMKEVIVNNTQIVECFYKNWSTVPENYLRKLL